MSAFRTTLSLAALALALALGACDPSAGGQSAPEPAATATEAGAESNPANPADEGSPTMNGDEPDATECGADKLDRWLGVVLTEALKADIREAAGHDRIRYIAPGDVVTMDFRPDRLNVETGEDGRIELFRCG